MKNSAFFLLLAAQVAFAQSGTAAKTTTHSARSAMAHPSTAHRAAAAKPAGEMPVVHGVVKTMFSERYEDYKIGTGPLAEPNKLYKVLYSGYLASTGQKFDSSDDHRTPEMKDGKPVIGPDGKVVLAPPQPLLFPQGFGRLIPGFDQGFTGMHVGGKRRIFIPWQLGYGTRDIPAHGSEHPGIPPKSNLIFDVELVEMTDMPKPPQQRPFGGVPPHPGSLPAHPAAPAAPGKPAEAVPPPASAPAPSAAPEAKPDSNQPK